MKKWIKYFPLALLFSIGVVAQAADKPAEIRFSIPSTSFQTTNAFYPVAELVIDHKLLEKEFAADGIKIKYSILKGAGPAVNESLAAGLGDFGNYGDLPVILGKAGGLPTKLVLGHEQGGNTFILARAELHINSLKDLKGKKIAIQKGTAGETNFYRFIEANGLNSKDFRIVNLSGADGQAALAAGSIDALSSGYDRPLVDQGLATVVADTRKFPNSIKSRGALVVTDAFARKYPDITKRVVKVFIEAAHFVSQDKNLPELLRVTTKAGYKYKYQREELVNTSLKDKYNPLLDQDLVNHYKAIVDFSLQHKLIRSKFDVDQFVDKSYSEAALKELGLQHYWDKH